ncbi:hypothetical protein GCM10011348_12520 [Marinobacterium nitratireducens]|uniref:Uncharacterized protein n=1 Tax=Marinobacterium nitratireducens TaxID=518897 RepID=A0A917Z9R8_9GAMM|nr:hypothetical protein GCM10011348_12520 [Marinobacterium nitratireducens]
MEIASSSAAAFDADPVAWTVHENLPIHCAPDRTGAAGMKVTVTMRRNQGGVRAMRNARTRRLT